VIVGMQGPLAADDKDPSSLTMKATYGAVNFFVQAPPKNVPH